MREEVVCFFVAGFLTVDFLTVDFLTVDFLALAFFELDECLAEVTFDFDDFDFAERADFDLDDFTAVQRTRVRLPCAPRTRLAFVQRTGFGAVQPISSSARKALGMARTGVGPSITARTAASERSDLTSAITFAGRCALAA